MAKVSAIQPAFNAGELSPLLYGRVDFDKYQLGLATCLNLVPLVQGPVTRRPGTIHVASVKTAADTTRVVRFEFSTTQAYILEFGDQYFRVYADHARVGSVEVSTPYTAAEVMDLRFTQSADVLYVAHPDHAPRKIERAAHTSWSISTITFLDGPYLPLNGTSTTLTFSATTGAGVTCTASANLFASTDVGRQIRAKTSGAAWGSATITAYTSATQVTVTIDNAMGATTATTNWRLGVWSDTTGYPSFVNFYQDRLCWDGGAGAPSSVYMSRTGAYTSHQPTDYDTSATVAADHAVSFTLNSNDVQIIRWFIGDQKGLLLGTVSAEWIVRPSELGEALSPTNINATEVGKYGSKFLPAVLAGSAALYVERGGRRVREAAFVFTEDRFKLPDMTTLAEHITAGGIVQTAFALKPYPVLWCVRGDGTLLGFTYDREQGVIGWHRHVLGGVSDANGTQAKVESVAVIPDPTGEWDELWMVVKRYINGGTVRYMEYLGKYWESDDTQATAVFGLDSAVVYDSTATSTITGLSHLEGATVGVKADGAAHPDKTVASSQITLARQASQVVVGLAHNSDGLTLRNNAGAADGTAQGKIQRSHRLTFRLYESLGFKSGPSFDDLERHIVREGDDEMTAAVPLFTGDYSRAWSGGYTKNNQIAFRWDQPFPGTLQGVYPQQVTQDGG